MQLLRKGVLGLASTGDLKKYNLSLSNLESFFLTDTFKYSQFGAC